MADNTNELVLTISVKDDGSVVIDSVKKKTDELGDATTRASSKASSALGGLKENWIALAAGVTAAYFTIKKSIDVLNSFVNEAAEAERIESRMAFQIEAVGIQYQKVNKYIDDYASAIQATTRFSDEMARESLGQMMMYTKDLGKAMTGAQLAMNMTTQTGMDLQSITRYVGMAMEGNIEILGRWIPELRNLKEKLGENASEAEITARAIEILNQKFSGAAQKDLSTYSGKLAQLKNQWSDIKEEIGRRLMPYMDDWVAGVQSILKISPSAAGAQDKLTESIKKAGEESKKAAAERRGYEEVTKYVTLAEEAQIAYKMIGIVSAATLQEQVSKTQWAVEKIREAWKAGKASVLDYANAINAATEALKKVTGPDTTKMKADLLVESQKKISEISPEDPERKKKIQAYIDDWIKARKEIEALDPVSLIADIPKMEADLNLYKGKAEQILESIKPPDPISITADISKFEAELNSARAQIDALRSAASQPIEIDVKATIESSPKVPFSQGIENMISKFGSLQKLLSGLEANIRFSEFGMQTTKVEKDIEKVRDAIPSMRRMSVDPYIEPQKRMAEISPEDPERAKKIDAIIDQWSEALRGVGPYGPEARQKLDEIAKAPISVDVDIAQGLEELNRLMEVRQKIGEGQTPISVDVDIAQGLEELNRLMEVRQKMEQSAQTPIPVTVNIGQLDSAFASAREKFESLRAALSQTIEINARATVESSPKVPFSQGIENMILKFGSLQGAIKGIEANIRFAEFTEQLKPLTKELAKVRDIVPSIKYAQSLFPTLDKSIDQRYLLQIKERETDLLSQINVIKMKSALAMLNMYGGSLQSGTQHVPKTGLYTLHEGEKVIPKGVSIGDINISVDGGGDPKKTVDLLVKTLKYRLSGELKNLL